MVGLFFLKEEEKRFNFIILIGISRFDIIRGRRDNVRLENEKSSIKKSKVCGLGLKNWGLTNRAAVVKKSLFVKRIRTGHNFRETGNGRNEISEEVGCEVRGAQA